MTVQEVRELEASGKAKVYGQRIPHNVYVEAQVGWYRKERSKLIGNLSKSMKSAQKQIKKINKFLVESLDEAKNKKLTKKQAADLHKERRAAQNKKIELNKDYIYANKQYDWYIANLHPV